MKAVLTVVLSVLLTGAAFGVPRSHYNMGPARGFTPEAGSPDVIELANGFVIDTRAGEPALPTGLGIEPPAGRALYIIQFTGPVLGAWRDALVRAGAGLYGALPANAMLAWLTPETRAAVAALPMVKWTGLYQPGYKLEDKLLDAWGERTVVILLSRGADAATMTEAIESRGGTVRDVMTSSFGTTITATLDGADIPALARMQETFWIQEYAEGSFTNNACQWVMQSGWLSSSPPDTSLAARPVWRNGVRGQGVIMSTTDTGLNLGHDMFRDPALSVQKPGVWPTHRKVVAYKRYGTADTSEGQYHGSHVNGTIAGDDSVTGGTSFYDGMAKSGRLYFVDVTNGTSFLVPTDHTPMWDTVYLGRGLPDSLKPIKQHSGSWGWSNSSGTYLLQDASTDQYCWVHPDWLCLMAAGNESSTRRLRNPGIAKNVLTIGATQNGTLSNAIASFSSRGPTQDNRIKPNIVAPGDLLWSARSTGTNTYQSMSGTSMATPAANGTVGLMRCYLQEGYYPTGTPVPGNRISYISSALLRAMAMVSADPNVGSYTVPDFNIGWGRVDADSVLYFAGDLRKLMLADDTIGLATGEYKEQQFRVNSSIPLRVALAWTDTAAAPSATRTLVNNLNLQLVSPTGVQYWGNQYTSGQSTPNPTLRDSINVEECARVNAPDTGLWTLRVYGQNVATGSRQRFAWALTGDVAGVSLTHDVGVTAILAPPDTMDYGDSIVPVGVVQNFGAETETFDVWFTIGTGYSVNRTVSLAAGAVDTVEFDIWHADSVGRFSTRCTTALGSDENPANNCFDGWVVVRPLTGIAASPDLPTAFALGRAQPNPFRRGFSLSYALPRTSRVELSIYSAAGTLVRTLETGERAPGRYSLRWDGRDRTGRPVSRGIYYIRLNADGFTASEKLVKID